jgi:HAMP domain-containing protein
MSHWTFVLAAYALAAVVLLGYWWAVERRLRALTPTEGLRAS